MSAPSWNANMQDLIPEWLSQLAAAVAALLTGAGSKSLYDWLRDRRAAKLEREKSVLQNNVALMQVIDARFAKIIEDDEKTIARLRDELSETKEELAETKRELNTAREAVEEQRAGLRRAWDYIEQLAALMRSHNIVVPARPK
jgi:septal ring factor EnvC (AmiA/AmiB activator)